MSAPMKFTCMGFFTDFARNRLLCPAGMLVFRRLLQCSAINEKKSGTGGMPKANRILERMIARGTDAKRKKNWYERRASKPMTFGHSVKATSGSRRRADVLGGLLHVNISNLIGNGEIDPRLVELGLEISQVRVAEYCNAVTIHWVASNTPKDDELEALLPNAARKLRLQLTMLRIMSGVPPITFSKDTSVAKRNEIEYLLSVADMGPDHEPTPFGADLKENYVLPVKKHRHRKKGVSDSSDTNASDENSDFSRSANQFHEFPDVGVKTDVKSENDDNLALHGITLEPEPSFPKFNLRENILDLDRDKFLQEILSMKRRAKDRTYPRQEQPKKMFQTDHIKVQDITKMLERKKKLKDPSRLERRAQRDAMNITPEHFKHLNKRGADNDDDYFDDYHEDWRNESRRDEFEDYR